MSAARRALLAVKAEAALIPVDRRTELDRRFLAAQQDAQKHVAYSRPS